MSEEICVAMGLVKSVIEQGQLHVLVTTSNTIAPASRTTRVMRTMGSGSLPEENAVRSAFPH